MSMLNRRNSAAKEKANRRDISNHQLRIYTGSLLSLEPNHTHTPSLNAKALQSQITTLRNKSPPSARQRSGSCTTPSGDHAAFLPPIQSTASAAFSMSQEGDLAMGGYCLPSRSTLGSQAQRSSSGMVSMTMGTWEPQPHQVDFSERTRVISMRSLMLCGAVHVA